MLDPANLEGPPTTAPAAFDSEADERRWGMRDLDDLALERLIESFYPCSSPQCSSSISTR